MKNPKRFLYSVLLGVVTFVITLCPNVLLLFLPNLLKDSLVHMILTSAFWGILLVIIMYIVLGERA
jgi:hypothetical protein